MNLDDAGQPATSTAFVGSCPAYEGFLCAIDRGPKASDVVAKRQDFFWRLPRKRGLYP